MGERESSPSPVMPRRSSAKTPPPPRSCPGENTSVVVADPAHALLLEQLAQRRRLGHTTTLDLQNLGIRVLPDQVFAKDLRVLDLRKNKLRNVDIDLSDAAPQLSEIYLDRNLLRAVPRGCERLGGLRVLSLGGNEISAWRGGRNGSVGSSEGCYYPELRELFLNSNRLEQLPERFAFDRNFVATPSSSSSSRQTSSLKKVHIQNNRFSEVPAGCFAALPELEELGLEWFSYLSSSGVRGDGEGGDAFLVVWAT